MKELLTILNQDVRTFGLINNDKRNPRFLFDNVNHLLNLIHNRLPATCSDDCDKFPNFKLPVLFCCLSSILFPCKISSISFHTGVHPALHIHFKLNFLEVLPVIAPCLFSVVNQPLSSGYIPEYFKTASVFPLLKTILSRYHQFS